MNDVQEKQDSAYPKVQLREILNRQEYRHLQSIFTEESDFNTFRHRLLDEILTQQKIDDLAKAGYDFNAVYLSYAISYQIFTLYKRKI